MNPRLKTEQANAAEAVDAPWRTLVLLCEKCPGARRGPDSRALKKGLKKTLGKHEALRVLEVDCLKVCPDDAVTVCVVDVDTREVSLQLVRSESELDVLAEALRGRFSRA